MLLVLKVAIFFDLYHLSCLNLSVQLIQVQLTDAHRRKENVEEHAEVRHKQHGRWYVHAKQGQTSETKLVTNFSVESLFIQEEHLSVKDCPNSACQANCNHVVVVRWWALSTDKREDYQRQDHITHRVHQVYEWLLLSPLYETADKEKHDVKDRQNFPSSLYLEQLHLKEFRS